MKILYFHQYFTTPKGSFGTRAYEFARRWVEAGHQVTVVTSVYDKSDLRGDGFLSRRTVDGIDLRIVNVRQSSKHNVLMRAFTFLSYAWMACWYALTNSGDVVVASSGPLTVGLPGLVFRLFRRRPFVFEVRDLFSEGVEQLGLVKRPGVIRMFRSFESLCYRTADVVVAVSTTMGEWIERDYNPRRVVIIPNAADNKLFGSPDHPVPTKLQDGKKAFLFTGTLGVANRCIRLVEAAEKLRDRGIDDVKIYLIGDGVEREALIRQAQAKGLKNIEFVPLMSKQELVGWLVHARAALLVLVDIPVFDTVSPNKLFDALAAGVPVIQTTGGWIKDLLAEREIGLTVDPGNPDSLVDHIQVLAEDDALRERMSLNAKEAGLTLYDRDLLSEQYLAMLSEVVGQ